jgi:hypothetical protein
VKLSPETATSPPNERKTLELEGIKQFEHLGLHEAGLRKGKCPVNEQNVAASVEAAKQVLTSNEAENKVR